MTPQIHHWRAQIDAVDRELLLLLNRRARLAARIGGCKAELALPLRDRQRERELLARLCAHNPGPFANASIARVFHLIIRETRRLEGQLTGGSGVHPGGEEAA